MSVLSTPLLELVLKFFQHPQSNETWEPPEWQDKESSKRILGRLSPDSWRIVGVMRDVHVYFQAEQQQAIDAGNFLKRAALERAMVATLVVLDDLLEAQVAADLSSEGVSPADVGAFCLRKGGFVSECPCKREAVSLSSMFESMLGVGDDSQEV